MFSQRGHCSSAITQPRAAARRQDLLQLDVCTCAHWRSLLVVGVQGLTLSVCTCRCFYMWVCVFVLIFAVLLHVFVCVCLWMLLWSSSWTDLLLGLELGAPNSVAAKVRSAAVPFNDVWEERGADKDSYSSARRHELTFDAHVHTHAQTRQDWRVQVYFQSNGQTAS